MTAAVSKAQLSRAIQALAAAGTPAKGILCLPDGSSAVLTEAPAVALPDADGGENWIALAGDQGAADAKGH